MAINMMFAGIIGIGGMAAMLVVPYVIDYEMDKHMSN